MYFDSVGSEYIRQVLSKCDNSHLIVNRQEILKLKANNNNLNFSIQFCLGSISNGFYAIESREVSLGEYEHKFLVDYNAIEKSDILNIHKYLMVKNNIKCLVFLNKCLLDY